MDDVDAAFSTRTFPTPVSGAQQRILISMLQIPRELFLLHATVSHTLFYLFSVFREREKDYLLFFLAKEIGNFC